MSKVSMPRPRYIAFKLEAERPVSRRALANALKGRARHDGWPDADAPVLTRYAWPHGIVRVEHLHLDKARALLAAVTWAVEGDAKVALKLKALSTSGTLKALTERIGVLQRRDPPAG